jgi:hypothetical protein
VPHAPKKKKQSGPHKPTANGTVILPEPIASTIATLRRTSHGAPGEVSGPMRGSPAGTTEARVQMNKAIPPEWRSNKTPEYMYGVRNVIKFLEGTHSNSGNLAAQMKGGYLMLVPQIADGFLATISERPAVATCWSTSTALTSRCGS